MEIRKKIRDVFMENQNHFREITAANMARLSNMSHSKSSGERYFEFFLPPIGKSSKTNLQINGLKRVQNLKLMWNMKGLKLL